MGGSIIKILGIETSCDETAAAVVENGNNILSSIIATQFEIHEKYHGVVPELASRRHSEVIGYIISESLKRANVYWDEIDSIAVVNRPGLVGSLIIGVAAAKGLAFNFKKPIISVDHLEAHLYTIFLQEKKFEFPYIGVIVSGGHTLILEAQGINNYKIIGSTLDDAVGEAYDKTAKMLGLPYPGGPSVDKIFDAKLINDIDFPKIMLKNEHSDDFNFSYSGLKTSVLNYIRKNKDYRVESVASSFQHAAIWVIYKKVKKYSEKSGINKIVLAGGVAANSYLRKLFKEDECMQAFFPDISLCTDNAAMVAGLAYHYRDSVINNYDIDVYAKSEKFRFLKK